jgi:hypothetical protein
MQNYCGWLSVIGDAGKRASRHCDGAKGCEVLAQKSISARGTRSRRSRFRFPPSTKAIWSPIASIASRNAVERGCAELLPSPYSHPSGLLRKVGQSFECLRVANLIYELGK